MVNSNLIDELCQLCGIVDTGVITGRYYDGFKNQQYPNSGIYNDRA